ncbi:MAG: uracil phosphoribosyltransferase [Bacteroidaceae bacterium]|nr:uracil phosphoribosyltransferase [Bacteroidaceae bacterium]
MKIVNLCETNSVVQQMVSELRDVNTQTDRHRFRWNLQRLGWITAYEISKTMRYEAREVRTPLGTATHRLPADEVVLATIFRAGLPFHQGFLDVFDKAGNAFVSAYRYYRDKECQQVGIKVEYIAAPSLEGKTLIIADPMLATGGSFELGYDAFLSKGTPRDVHFCAVIASQQGVDNMKRLYGDTDFTLWCCAIDPVLNEHKYIVPGLGDAGDLAFGDKI